MEVIQVYNAKDDIILYQQISNVLSGIGYYSKDVQPSTWAGLEGHYKLLWIIPATMIIWANMHGGCFVGLGLIFLYALGEFLNKKRFTPYIIVLALSLCAMFINPYGIKYVYFLFHAITLKRTAITEWQPIFHQIHVLKFFKFKFWAFAVAIITGVFIVKNTVSLEQI